MRKLLLVHTFLPMARRSTSVLSVGRDKRDKLLYVAVGKRLKTECDDNVVRGTLEGPDHHAMLMTVKVNDKWRLTKRINEDRRRLKLQTLKEKNERGGVCISQE